MPLLFLSAPTSIFTPNRAHTRNRNSHICCSAARAQKLPPVVFVLGGPGSGKGTQCAKLVEEFGYAHVTVGDLLRAEAATGSSEGMQVAQIIRDGGIVPSHITMTLLRNTLSTGNSSNRAVLIDGFPRVMEQAIDFEKSVSLCNFVLFFSCEPAEMRKRILARAKTSGRVDDNDEVIDLRLKTYMNQTMPVIDYFEGKGLLRRVDSNIGGPDEVYEKTRSLFLQANF